MYEMLHPGKEAQGYPKVILCSRAIRKHPATLLQRFCSPNTSLLGGDTTLSDMGVGDAQQSMGSRGSRGSSQEGGPLLSGWGEAGTPGLCLPFPGNLGGWTLGLAVFPKTRISLQAWPVDRLEMIPGFGDLIPAPRPILHDKTWIHLPGGRQVWRAGFARLRLQGDALAHRTCRVGQCCGVLVYPELVLTSPLCQPGEKTCWSGQRQVMEVAVAQDTLPMQWTCAGHRVCALHAQGERTCHAPGSLP